MPKIRGEWVMRGWIPRGENQRGYGVEVGAHSITLFVWERAYCVTWVRLCEDLYDLRDGVLEELKRMREDWKEVVG
jgi:hypothetical protein